MSTEDWIEWNGGECPLADGPEVEIKFRDGTLQRMDDPNREDWQHLPDDPILDIIAYRIVKP